MDENRGTSPSAPRQRDCEQFVNPKKYEIRINELSNGFVVTVGCESFVFEDCNNMLHCLKKYLENRNAVTKMWLDHKVLPS